ncbi:MAG: hypothetical protein LBO00_05965 [Zoogloeaceae bacterium]|nr:hypothetical protein [Zoogloeaceae bacterium]
MLMAAAFSLPATGAGTIKPSNQPLMVGGGQPANVMLLFDNSIGMASFQLPTNVPEFGQHTGTSYRRQHYGNLAARSVHLNKLAYNPRKEYSRPRKQDICSGGVCMRDYYPNVPFSAAPRDGFGAGHPTPNATVDLSRDYQDRTYGGLTVTSRSQPDDDGACTRGTGPVPYLNDGNCSEDNRDARPRSAYYTYFRPDREGPYASGTGVSVVNGVTETQVFEFTGASGSNSNLSSMVLTVAGIPVQLGKRGDLPAGHVCKSKAPSTTSSNWDVAERVECVLKNTSAFTDNWTVTRHWGKLTLTSKIPDQNVANLPEVGLGTSKLSLINKSYTEGAARSFTPASKGCVYQVFKKNTKNADGTYRIYNIVDLDPRKDAKLYKPSWCLSADRKSVVGTAAECVTNRIDGAGDREDDGWWAIAQLVGNTGDDANNNGQWDGWRIGSIPVGETKYSAYRVVNGSGGQYFRTPFQACFEVVTVGSARDRELTNMTADGARQNFANWYSYYSSRVNLLKVSMSEVMNDLDEDIRIGFGVTGAVKWAVDYAGTSVCDSTPSAGVSADCPNGRAFNSLNPAAWGMTSKVFKAGLRPNLVDNMASPANGDGFYGIERGVRPFRNFENDDKSVPPGYRGKKFKDEAFDYLFSLSTASIRDSEMLKQGTSSKASDAAGARTGNLAALRRALGEAGEYFRTGKPTGPDTGPDLRSPWSIYPGLGAITPDPSKGETFRKQKILACRKSYAVLVTAGTYNKNNDDSGHDQSLPVNACAHGDQDGVSGPSFTYTPSTAPVYASTCLGALANTSSADYKDSRKVGTKMDGSDLTFGEYRMSMTPVGTKGEVFPYEPKLPFADRKNGSDYSGYKNTLADVAMAYWKSDLLVGRSDNADDFANNVPISGEDYAYWQHMNTVILQMGDSASVRAQGASDAEYAPVVESVVRGEAWLLAKDPRWGYSDSADAPKCGESNPTGDGVGGTEWCDPIGDTGVDLGSSSKGAQVLGVPRSRMYGNDLLHAAINGRGGYYSVESPEGLADALRKAMESMKESGFSFTRVETNSGSRAPRALLYYAKFSSNNWYGDLDAYRICTGADVERDWDRTVNPPTWKAGQGNSRSQCRNEGDPWKWPDWRVNSKDGGGAQGVLNTQALDRRNIYAGMGWGDSALVEFTTAKAREFGLSADLIEYLRGSAAQEAQNGGPFRDRNTSEMTVICGTDANPEPCKTDGSNRETAHRPAPERHLMGDIINSSPVFVGNDDFGFSSAGSLTIAQRIAYITRKTTTNKNRRELVWVGANDGMLHAFDASPNSTSDGTRGSGDAGGKEIFAFIPYHALLKIGALSRPNYIHEYYVDGEIAVGDALLAAAGGDEWHTVLVGSSGLGGGAYYALDIEDPDNIKKLWEVSSAASETEDRYGKIGAFTVGKASIAQVGVAVSGASPTTAGQWAAVFGNGYNSTGNVAALYVVNLKDGAPIAVLTTPADTPPNTAANGLAAPVLADFEHDGRADVAYAGDLYGNLWRFPLGKLDGDKTGAGAATLIFKAGADQPITGQPEVAVIKGKVMVYFGTGKYLEMEDRDSVAVQAFYGVQDPCGKSSSACTATPLTPADLVQQTITKEVQKRVCPVGTGTTCVSPTVADVRLVSNNTPVPHATTGALDKFGFYLTLKVDSKNAEGERVIAKPVVWDDRVMFTSIIPGDNSCATEGDGWLYELDPEWGGRLKFSVFDLDGDKKFGDVNDEVDGKYASGRRVGLNGGGLSTRGNTKYVGGKGGITAIANNPEQGVQGRRAILRLR